MKKKMLSIIACLTLAACLFLTGCGSTGSFSKIKVEGTQDYTYTVYSNGGNSVQYGNYIYFINGTRGYEDADGKQNVWKDDTVSDDVEKLYRTKGGLYRAELSGVPSTDVTGDFTITTNADAQNTPGLEFKSTPGTDYDENPIDVVNVQLIAPKTIGTSGYKDGGIFIFDEWVYYATPNNEKDKTGTVQINKTDFMRTKLDGSQTQRIYTTDVDSASSPYAFYKYNGAVYLVSFCGGKVVSVRIGDKKIDKPVTISGDETISGALLPYNTTYKKGMHTNSAQDFIYLLRAAKDYEPETTGVAIEIVRPDGSAAEGGTYLRLGNDSDKLVAVRDGMLFYSTTNSSGQTLINYDNLHTFFMNNSPSYKAYQESLDAFKDSTDEKQLETYYREKITDNVSGTLLSMASESTYTSTYCFRPAGVNSDLVYAIATDASGAYLISPGMETVYFYDAAMTISFVQGEYVYFTESEGKVLYRTKWSVPASEKAAEEKKQQVSNGDMADNGLRPDYCAGYVVYMGTVDEWASGYALFQKVDGAEGIEEVFVGARIAADIKPEEEDDEDESEEKSGCGSSLIMTVGTGVSAAAVLLLTGGAMLLMAYRRKKDRR